MKTGKASRSARRLQWRRAGFRRFCKPPWRACDGRRLAGRLEAWDHGRPRAEQVESNAISKTVTDSRLGGARRRTAPAALF